MPAAFEKILGSSENDAGVCYPLELLFEKLANCLQPLLAVVLSRRDPKSKPGILCKKGVGDVLMPFDCNDAGPVAQKPAVTRGLQSLAMGCEKCGRLLPLLAERGQSDRNDDRLMVAGIGSDAFVALLLGGGPVEFDRTRHGPDDQCGRQLDRAL